MTDTPQEPGDQPDDAEPAASPPAADQSAPTAPVADPRAFTPAAHPGYAYPSYPQQMLPPPPSNKKTSVIVAAVIGLLAGIGIGAGGVAIATSSDDDPSVTADPTRTPPIATETTTTTESAAGEYSMDSVTNACEIIDLTLLHRWGPTTPRTGPENLETRPRRLSCQVGYSAPSTTDEFENNETGLDFEAEFTQDSADPAYVQWKNRDTDTTGSNLDFGDVTGIGTEGYWFSEKSDDLMGGMSYTVAVLDSNVSVKARISLTRADGERPVAWEEMDEVAKAEVQLALEALKK